nr:MAG TPA: hypothetical protein [Caudoviricetes sp.]
MKRTRKPNSCGSRLSIAAAYSVIFSFTRVPPLALIARLMSAFAVTILVNSSATLILNSLQNIFHSDQDSAKFLQGRFNGFTGKIRSGVSDLDIRSRVDNKLDPKSRKIRNSKTFHRLCGGQHRQVFMIIGPFGGIGDEPGSVTGCCESHMGVPGVGILSGLTLRTGHQTVTVAPAGIPSRSGSPDSGITFQTHPEEAVLRSLNFVPILTEFRLSFGKYHIKTGCTQCPHLCLRQIFALNLRWVAGGADSVSNGEAFYLKNEYFVSACIESDQLAVKGRHAFLSSQKSVQLLGVCAPDRNGELRKGKFHLIDRLRNALNRDFVMICDQNIIAGGIEVVVHNKLPGRYILELRHRVWIGVFCICEHAHLQTSRNAAREGWSSRVFRICVIADRAEGTVGSDVKCQGLHLLPLFIL